MKSRLLNPTALVLAILALGFGLRLYRLDAQSFWFDEACSAAIAKGTFVQIVSNRFLDVHPPLYYLVLHSWQAISDSDFALRLLSAMWGTAAIGSMYALGKATFDPRVGLGAATITCLSPYAVYYSQEARMYSLLLLLSSMMLLTYHRMLHTRSRRWWLAYTVCVVSSLYVQYVSALLLLALHLHFLITSRRDRGSWVLLATSDALALLALAPQLAILLGQAHLVAVHQWTAPPTPGIARLLSAPYALTLSQFVSQRVVTLSFAVVLVVFIVAHLQLGRRLMRRGDPGGRLSLLLYTLWTPLLSAFIISQWRSIYRERALIVVVPALYLLLSWGIVKTRERYFNLACLLVLGAVGLGALSNWYFDPSFGKPPFRIVGEALTAEACEGQPVIHTSDGALLVLIHYAPDCEHFLLKGDPAPQWPLETYELVGGHVIAKEDLPGESFWLVVALDNSIEFQRGIAGWIDQHYRVAEARDFEDIYLRRYHGVRSR